MNIVKTDNGTDPLTEARELIAQEIKEREEKCFAAVAKVLEDFHCQLAITVQVAGQRVPVNSLVVPPVEIMIEALK